jgi:two-component system, chemotaxis family, response regulator WspF
MRIAIVNDSLMAVEALRRVIVQAIGLEVAWIAYNGTAALSQCAIDRPDLILMDLLMPDLDGVETTRRIMSQSPCAILIVTASVGRYSAQVFAAMGYGALDAINTPALDSNSTKLHGSGHGIAKPPGEAGLLSKIAMIAKLIGKAPRRSQSNPMICALQNPISQLATLPLLTVIGASTGGPSVLANILSQLSADLATAIVIVQHVDAEFAAGLAEWLAQQSRLPVRLAQAGERPAVGQVLLAGTNQHLILRPSLTLDYAPEPRDISYHPSVDVFFESVANHWQSQGVAALLTGMGRDGAKGLLKLRQTGWQTIAQNAASCIVYGMPKAAVDLNAATQVLSPDQIAAELILRSRSK